MVNLINQEIKWRESNFEFKGELTDSEAKQFIKGLKQAKQLLSNAYIEVKDSE